MPDDTEPTSIFDLFGRYRKVVITGATTLLTWGGLVVASSNPGITGQEWIALGLAIVGTAAVGVVPNKE